VKCNAEVLNATGYPFDNTWLYEPMPQFCAARIADLRALPGHAEFVATYEASRPWLWKDPRLCYTVGYWWPLMDPSTTRVVVIQRDPEAIYQSFIRLGWRQPSPASKSDVLSRINAHLSAAREAVGSLGIPHEVVAYESFRTDPADVSARLNRLLDLSLDTADLEFDAALDRSHLRGRVATKIDRAANHVPPVARRVIKRLIPSQIMKFLFPERFIKQ
jgi:hypothetical protein